jgi:1,4-dihydroxy-2-naphthoate octaprenyltransferase
MSTKHAANLRKAANTRLGRRGVMLFAVAWLFIGYVSASQAIDTGSWVMYLLTVIALLQVVRFVKLSLKAHDNK